MVLALVVEFVLFRRRRWDHTSRWIELVAGAVGALTLVVRGEEAA